MLEQSDTLPRKVTYFIDRLAKNVKKERRLSEVIVEYLSQRIREPASIVLSSRQRALEMTDTIHPPEVFRSGL